uniref:ORF76 n=1 Tax=Tetradesmus obliquus TaxID=3088 RepID=Q9MD35_TETOB|nr:ORF76 [Tetradesmus obliquus]CAB90358.1 ORF76 [Tetradesmus obliquus]
MCISFIQIKNFYFLSFIKNFYFLSFIKNFYFLSFIKNFYFLSFIKNLYYNLLFKKCKDYSKDSFFCIFYNIKKSLL